MGNRPLTWQETVIVLLLLVVLIGSIMAWGGDIPDRVRPKGVLMVVCTTPLVIALFAWNWRNLHRADLLPDILAKEFPLKSIFQMGGSHFAVAAGQNGSDLVLTCIVQNLKYKQNRLQLQLQPDKGKQLLAADVPPLVIEIPPGSVVRNDIRIPLKELKVYTMVRLVINGTCTSSGRQVRFARRTAISLQVPTALTGLLLVTGTVVHGGGTFISVGIDSAMWQLGRLSQLSEQWVSKTVWEPSESDKARLLQRL